ncbi:cytochrome P450 [Aspergillus sclerotioniger CBS 115572]|uniref:Cytochrome P450 n=1 Tax=Aspergillus sclerotioniger CBS 115572 TaxID=1450535 RepID=A0A317X4W0_9EURO|nr:cytochrome P450 [Aspergillus sclerotioniger CBS 115572]PWY93639.1 cytochrome P450 [Aspergillus sclerotioniger CBS 115572]
MVELWSWALGNAPSTVGYRSFFEPRWLLGFRFTRGGQEMLRQGYQQASCRRRRQAPPKALFNKGLGSYTGLSIILESRLHIQVIQQRLTPTLATVMGEVKDELEYAFHSGDLPDCLDTWVSVDIHTTLARLISLLSSRVFGGTELSRDEEWLSTSTQYPKNAFATAMALRMVPVVLRPFIAVLLPHYWHTQSNLASAKRIIGAIVRRRRTAGAEHEGAYKKPNDLLQWMMDAADERDGRPDKLGHRLLFVSDASIMTTSLLITHCIYDLCAHPQYLVPLREEILAVLREGGDFQKTMLHKMRKLDSCLKESQRLNPPFLMTFDRILREPITLSDGKRLPVGAHVAIATDAMLHDAHYLPSGGADPDSFDPFRYARAREDPGKPENAQRYQLATTEVTSLPFGHGKHACPGRFFASSQAKLVLCHLLLRYDFCLPEGKTRPKNLLFFGECRTRP